MKKLYKLITWTLVIIFLCQDIGWSAPIAQPKNINLQLSTIFIPEQYGSVEKSNPVNGQTVILLKDAHCNYETQTNIIKILDTLIRDYKIDLIGVEGASGYVNPSIVLESNPKDDLREKVSDRYLRTGLLTASEALSINMGKEPGFSIFGTEDLRLYLKDFKAFRDTIGLNPYARRFNELVSNVISQLKGKIYPPGLTGFDVVVKKYESNSLPLSRLIKILIYNYGIQNGYENLKLVYKSIRLDERIDFKKAERERTGLIKELEKSMPKEDLQELVKKSLLYKLGKIPAIEYYTYLEPLVRTANLKDYIRLIKLQDRIDETGLFRELDGFIERIYARLCPNKTAVDLHQLDKNIGILNKLLHLEATRDDLAYYRENAALFMPEKLLQFIKIQAPLNNIKLPPELNESSFIENTRKAIIPAGEFYKFALERDNALVENLLSIMQKNKKEKAVLICGGFHTEGIKGILQDRNISILTITPSITRVQEDAHELYLARMLDKRIDPEKMLSELGIENIQPILATSPAGQRIGLHTELRDALIGRGISVEEAVTPDEFRRLHPLLLELHTQGGSLAAMVQQAVDGYNALSGVKKISLPQGLSAWRTKLDKLTEEEAGEYDNYMREIGRYLVRAGISEEDAIKLLEQLDNFILAQDRVSEEFAYIPINARHVLNTARNIIAILNNPGFQKRRAVLEGQYGSDAVRPLFLFLALSHQVGYRMVEVGKPETYARYREFGAGMVSDNFGAVIKRVFGSDALNNILDAVRQQGERREGMLPNNDPLLFLLTLAQQMDISARRLEEWQKSPFFIQILSRITVDNKYIEAKLKLENMRRTYGEAHGEFLNVKKELRELIHRQSSEELEKLRSKKLVGDSEYTAIKRALQSVDLEGLDFFLGTAMIENIRISFDSEGRLLVKVYTADKAMEYGSFANTEFYVNLVVERMQRSILDLAEGEIKVELTSSELRQELGVFIERLPLAELHSHLNGAIEFNRQWQILIDRHNGPEEERVDWNNIKEKDINSRLRQLYPDRGDINLNNTFDTAMYARSFLVMILRERGEPVSDNTSDLELLPLVNKHLKENPNLYTTLRLYINMRNHFRSLVEYLPVEEGKLPEFVMHFAVGSAIGKEGDREKELRHLENNADYLAMSSYRANGYYYEYRINLGKTKKETQEEIEAIKRGIEKAEKKIAKDLREGEPGFEGRIVLSFGRTGNKPEVYTEQAKEFVAMLGELREKNPKLLERVAGIDVANQEEGTPPEAFREAFKKIEEYNNQTLPEDQRLQMTYHIGEGFTDVSLETSLRFVDEVIDYGAKRLGHAIILGIDPAQFTKEPRQELVSERIKTLNWLRGFSEELGLEYFTVEYIDSELKQLKGETISVSYTDQARSDIEKIQDYLLKKVIEKNIVIETNPTSNTAIVVRDMKRHPLRKFLAFRHPESGKRVRFTINTDDAGVFGTDLRREYLRAAEAFGLTVQELWEIASEGFRAHMGRGLRYQKEIDAQREKAKAGRTKKWMGIDSGDLSGENIVKEDTGLIEEQDKKGVLDLIERKLGSQSTTFKALRNSRAVDPQGNTIDIEFKWGILTKGVEAHSIRDENRVIIYLDKNFIETVPEEDKPLVIAQLIHHEITEQIEGKNHTKAVLAEFKLEDDKSKPVSRASEIILEKAIQQAIEEDGDAQAYLKKLTENTNNAVREIINNTSLSSAEQTRLINMAFAIHGMITGNKELAKKGILPIESIMPYQILEERILKDDLMYFMGAAGRGHYGLLNYLMGFISFTVFAFINLFGIIPLIKFLIRIILGSTMGVRFGGQYAPRRITRAETIRYKEEKRLLIEALEKTDKTIESFFKEIFPLYLHLLNNEESDELIDQRVINFSSNISEELRNYITEIQSSLKSRQKISKEAFKERLFYATNTFNNRYLIDNGYYMQGLSLEGPRLLFNFSRITRLREANRIRVLFIEGIILQNEKEFETTGGYSVPSRDMPDVVVLTNNVKKVSGEEIPTEKPGIWHRLLAERLRQLNIRMDKREGFLYDYLCRSYATHEMQHKNIERQEPDRRSFVYSRNHLEQIAGITLDDNEMSSFLAQFLSEDTKIELAYLMRYLSKAEDIIHAIDIHQRKIREYEQEKNILKKLSLWVQRLIFGDRYVFTPEPSIDPHLAALLLIIDRFYSFARTEGKINQEELDRMEKITDLNQRLAETGKQLFYRTKAGDLRRYAVMLFEERLSKYSIGFNDVDKQLLEIHKLLREHYYTDALRLLDRLPLELDGLAIRDLPSGQIIRLVREQIGLIPAEEINIKRKIQANLRKFVQASKERDTEIRTKLEEPAVMAHFEELAVGEDLVYDDGTKARGTLSAEDVRRITDSIQRKGRPVETGLGITLKLKDSELNNILLENLAKLLEKLQESEREEFLAKLKANAPPDGLVIAILDQSEHLGENCKGDGFIGVNRYLLLKLQEAVDQDTRDALSNLLQVILYHELRHEARMFEGPDEEFRQNLVDIRYLEGRWMDILIRLGLINPESKFKKITDTVNEIADRLGKYGIEMDDNQKEELKKNLLEAYEGKSQINLLQLINMLAKRITPEEIFQLTADIAEPINKFLGNKDASKGGMMIAAVLKEILELMPTSVESEEDRLLKTIQALAKEKGIDPNAMQSVFDLFRSGLEILAVDPSYKLDSNYFVLISQIEKLTGIDDKKIIEVFERRGLSRERAEAVPDSPLAQEVQKLALYIELNNISIRSDMDLEFDSRRGLFYLDDFTGKIDRKDNGDIRFLSAVDAVNKDLAKAYNEMRRGPGGPIIDRTEPATLVISSEEIIDIEGNRFSYKPGIQALLKTLANGKNIHIIIRADRQARHLLEKTGILNEQITVEDSEKNLKDIRTDAELSGWARDGDHVVFLLTPEEGESIETKGLKVFGTAAGTAFHTALLFGVAYAQAQTIDEIVTAINTLKLLGMAPAEVDEIIRNIKEKGLGFFTVRLIRIEETLKELRTRRLYIEVAA